MDEKKKLDGEDNTNRKSEIHAHKQQMKKKTKIGGNVRVIGKRAQILNHRFTRTIHCIFQPKNEKKKEKKITSLRSVVNAQ